MYASGIFSRQATDSTVQCTESLLSQQPGRVRGVCTTCFLIPTAYACFEHNADNADVRRYS